MLGRSRSITAATERADRFCHIIVLPRWSKTMLLALCIAHPALSTGQAALVERAHHMHINNSALHV